MAKDKLKEYPVATTVLELGSLPLRNRKQELYAQQRALFNSATVSARNAGYKGHVDVIASELEIKPKVRARISHLARDPENALREKRKRLEEFLWDAIEIDRANYYETVEVVTTDRSGIPILDRNGVPKTKVVAQLKPLEMLKPHERRLIESISYTDSGKPNLKLVSKEFAHRELRRMLGGDKEQGAVAGSTFAQFTDAELFAELGRLANQLGIKTTLTIEPDNVVGSVVGSAKLEQKD